MRGLEKTTVALVLAAASCLAGACGGGRGDAFTGSPSADAKDSPVLARVGAETLTLAEARASLPGGLTAEDSAKFVKGYVYSWVDRRLLAEMAEEDLDTREIDRLVEEYRQSLIAEAYRRKIAEDGADVTFAEDSLRAYYDAHRTDFRLRSPLVRGVYVKLPDEAKNLSLIRRLMRSDALADIDRLEKEVTVSNAIHYDYFRERWIDWDQIEVRIPFDFGASESFLRKDRFLETSRDGFTYLLRVTDVLPASSVMPFEAARDEVRERLLAERRRKIDAAFRADLLRRALSTNRAEIFVE